MRLIFLGTGAGEGYPDIFCECAGCREARMLGGRNFAIIMEETMGPGEYPQHMNCEGFLEHCRRFRQQGMLRGRKLVIATHIGHNWNPPHDKLVQILEPHGVIVAYDGLVIEL